MFSFGNFSYFNIRHRKLLTRDDLNMILGKVMMESMESSCVPPGFRFHPTDEELVGYYLRKKVASQKIDLDVIRDIDLYRIEPWDLQGMNYIKTRYFKFTINT